VLEGITTPDTLGDEPIQISGDLTSVSTYGMSSSDAGNTTTDDTSDISINLETEYMTAYVDSRIPMDPHMTASHLSGGTAEPIPSHGAASMNQTMLRDERLDCVDFPADEVVSNDTMTAVVPCINATRGDLQTSSTGMLQYSTVNQTHSLNTEYMTAEVTSY
jgi:hypothetical protein